MPGVTIKHVTEAKPASGADARSDIDAVESASEAPPPPSVANPPKDESQKKAQPQTSKR